MIPEKTTTFNNCNLVMGKDTTVANGGVFTYEDTPKNINQLLIESVESTYYCVKFGNPNNDKLLERAAKTNNWWIKSGCDFTSTNISDDNNNLINIMVKINGDVLDLDKLPASPYTADENTINGLPRSDFIHNFPPLASMIDFVENEISNAKKTPLLEIALQKGAIEFATLLLRMGRSVPQDLTPEMKNNLEAAQKAIMTDNEKLFKMGSKVEESTLHQLTQDVVSCILTKCAELTAWKKV